jgi:uncharacterized protein YndB with AHSA1/START domain
VRLVREDGGVDLQGEVLRVEPPRILSYMFGVEGADGRLRERPSRVTFEITPSMGSVKLTLIHDDFAPGSTMLDEISQGWPAILSGLKSLLERGRALFPDWQHAEEMR